MVMHAGSLDNIANPKRLDSAQTPPMMMSVSPSNCFSFIAAHIHHDALLDPLMTARRPKTLIIEKQPMRHF